MTHAWERHGSRQYEVVFAKLNAGVDRLSAVIRLDEPYWQQIICKGCVCMSARSLLRERLNPHPSTVLSTRPWGQVRSYTNSEVVKIEVSSLTTAFFYISKSGLLTVDRTGRCL